jgi:hypothetical protein
MGKGGGDEIGVNRICSDIAGLCIDTGAQKFYLFFYQTHFFGKPETDGFS